MNLDEERKYCEKVYKKWDFVNRIVELYAEGVSWKGRDLTGVDAIKDGVRNMLVTGAGDFKIKGQNEMQTFKVQMPRNNPIEQPGHPFLWPVTRNASHLDDIQNKLGSNVGADELFQILVKDICLGLGVPYELLGPQSTTAPAYAIMWGLTTFRGNVKSWRDYLGNHLRLSWKEEWFLDGLAAYGPIYQVFKARGIDLSTLAKQVLTTAKSALDNSLISKQTYEESVKWFLEN